MTPRPWIKLHTHIIDDVRILKLNDTQQLRYYQLYALAGKLNADGAFIENGQRLDEKDIAIKLRIADAKKLAADLKVLKSAGLLKANGHGPYVAAFAEEQVDWSAKQEQDRARKQKQRHADVTRDSSDVTPKSRDGHAPRPDQKKKRKDQTRREEEKKKTRPEQRSGSGGGGDPLFKLTKDQLSRFEQAGAVLSLAGLRGDELEDAARTIALRTSVRQPAHYALAALASCFADNAVRNKVIVAARRIKDDMVNESFMVRETWRILPEKVLKAAGVDPSEFKSVKLAPGQVRI